MDHAPTYDDLPYFDIAGYHLEKENHGAPQCPDIARNAINIDRMKPQAWSLEIFGATHWLYNFP